MIQPQPAWVQHNNNKSLFWCTEQSDNGSGISAPVCLKVWEKSQEKKICFSYDRMDSYSLYLNDKSVSLFERGLFGSHHGAATADLAQRSTLNGINYCPQADDCFESQTFFYFVSRIRNNIFCAFAFPSVLEARTLAIIVPTNLFGFLVSIISLKLISWRALHQKITAEWWK